MGRPWETEMIVFGFPSKLTALQFEWSWQNPELSRHLVTLVTFRHGGDTKSERYFRKRSHGMNHPQLKVAVLQRMLVSKPWASLHLRVMIFSRDAQTWWRDASLHGGSNPKPTASPRGRKADPIMDPSISLPDVSHIETTTRLEGVDGGRLFREGGKDHPDVGPIRIDDWDFVENQWTKWQSLIHHKLKCACCHQPIDFDVRRSLMNKLDTCIDVFWALGSFVLFPVYSLSLVLLCHPPRLSSRQKHLATPYTRVCHLPKLFTRDSVAGSHQGLLSKIGLSKWRLSQTT